MEDDHVLPHMKRLLGLRDMSLEIHVKYMNARSCTLANGEMKAQAPTRVSMHIFAVNTCVYIHIHVDVDGQYLCIHLHLH